MKNLAFAHTHTTNAAATAAAFVFSTTHYLNLGCLGDGSDDHTRDALKGEIVIEGGRILHDASCEGRAEVLCRGHTSDKDFDGDLNGSSRHMNRDGITTVDASGNCKGEHDSMPLA